VSEPAWWDERMGELPAGTRKVPAAAHFRISFCGECPNAHLLFFDEADQPIAQATLSLAQCNGIAGLIKIRDWGGPPDEA